MNTYVFLNVLLIYWFEMALFVGIRQVIEENVGLRCFLRIRLCW